MAQLISVRPNGFPWATFWTNVSGSLAIGVVVVVLLERFPPSRHVRAFVVTGFLGAYTTYSTFAVDTVVLTKDGHMGVAGGYAATTLLAGLLAAWLGVLAARALPLPSRAAQR
jgi:CrcB protein